MENWQVLFMFRATEKDFFHPPCPKKEEAKN